MKINSIIDKYGIDLQIGFTDICNFRCIMCLQTSHNGLYGSKEIKTPILHKNKRGFISDKTLNNIINSAKKINAIRLIKLQWLGESLLHPEFNHFTERILSAGLSKKIMATTTLFQFQKHDISIMLNNIKKSDSHFFLIVSLDSFSKDTYSSIKGIDALPKVLKNLNDLINIRNNLGVDNLHIILQMIVMEENHKDAGEFLNNSKKLLKDPMVIYDQECVPMVNKDKIFFKRLGAVEQKKYEDLHTKVIVSLGLLPKQASSFNTIITTSTIKYNNERRPCPAPFLTPTINWDGRVTVCCMDAEMELSIGNVNDTPLNELWKNNLVRALRKAHINGDLSSFPRCVRCENIDLLPIIV